jgi:hypothetical protein
VPELLVVVLEVGATAVRAALADVDRPGLVHRDAGGARSDDLLDDARAALTELDAGDRGSVLLALAVAVDADVAAADLAQLRASFDGELPEGWGLPAPLPVVWGSADGWRAQGAAVPDRPAVAAAVVAAARAVGAHAHLPPG